MIDEGGTLEPYHIMATIPSYIPLRDDAGIKSISKNEQDFIRSCALQDDDRILRLDGRAAQQSRPTRLVLTRYPHNGASAATVTWGTGTRVSTTCTSDIVPPTDRPNEGIVQISVELSPSASTSFRQVPAVTNLGALPGSRGGGTADEAQKLETNRILRALERLLTSCLDAEALVVTPGQWVWKLSLHVVVQDAAAGNLMDACWMCVLAALQHYRQPHTEARSDDTSNTNNNGDGDTANNQNNPLAPVLVSLDAKEGTPLPLHQVPFAVTFALITDESDATVSRRKVVLLQDPSLQEEMIAAGHFTYALNVHQEVCLVDFGGGAEINLMLVRDVHDAAAKQVGILAKALQETLAMADQEAIEQRLKSLKLPNKIIPATAALNLDGILDESIDLPPLPQGEIKSPDELKAEEEYRKQALDYNLGHVAQPIADDKTKKIESSKGTSALLASLLLTASQIQDDKKEQEANVTMDVPAPAPGHLPTKTSPTKTSAAKMNLDSDEEEETTMQLESEFSVVSKPTSRPKAGQTTEMSRPTPAAQEEDDVDDLAAAIKTKKKKKKKK